MTKQQLSEIRARCEATTQGKWKAVFLQNAKDKTFAEVDAKNWYVSEIKCGTRGDRMVLCHVDYHTSEDHHNFNFIAHAHSDVPALLNEIERLQKENNELNEDVCNSGVIGHLQGQESAKDEIERLRSIIKQARHESSWPLVKLLLDKALNV